MSEFDIDVKDMLEELGMDNVHDVGFDEVGFSCPRSDGHQFGDSTPSNHMNKNDPHPFRCKGCGWTGTAFSFVGSVLKLTPVETTRWLRDRYGGGYREPKGGSVAAEMEMSEQRRTQLLAELELRLNPPPADEEQTIGERGIFHMDWSSDHPAAEYMRSRGFDPLFLSIMRVGFDTWTNRVAIPIRNELGEVVGFKGRAIESHVDPKYLILGDSPERKLRYGVGYGFGMYDPSLVVFGLDGVRTLTQPIDLIVCEGELNKYAIEQMRAPIRAWPVAIGTTYVSAQQMRLLRWYARRLILFLDDDDAGFAATWGYMRDERFYPGIVEKMSPYLPILVVDKHDGDPASMLQEGREDECAELIRSARSWMSIAVE